MSVKGTPLPDPKILADWCFNIEKWKIQCTIGSKFSYLDSQYCKNDETIIFVGVALGFSRHTTKFALNVLNQSVTLGTIHDPRGHKAVGGTGLLSTFFVFRPRPHYKMPGGGGALPFFTLVIFRVHVDNGWPFIALLDIIPDYHYNNIDD